ncbi:AraC family transcriptional regulator [uncultured Victivallis sp.]|uniref:helix-turn-helix transcriptional regulator n=1 Tax=uncultured Victivallis sp. TaxID=354118 RepID=UPI0025E51351|nr:AraC family transcriptional regulator [uncultured Victivallis sp.]
MDSAAKIKQRIQTRAEKIRDPDSYLRGRCGGMQEEPDNILIFRRSPERKIHLMAEPAELYHPRYVLTVNLSGEGLICVNEKSFPLPEDYASLVYPYQLHHYLMDQNNFFWLVITFELHQGAWIPNLMYRSTRLGEIHWQLLARMLELYFAPADPGGVAARLLQRYLGCFLLELSDCCERIDADRHLAADNVHVRLFEKINGYIFQKLSDPGLSVEEIARRHEISPARLYRLFHNMAGCNPGEYIRGIRIRQAVKLLESRELLVSEVADRTGFSSLPVFCRCFRNLTGCSPREYLHFHADAEGTPAFSEKGKKNGTPIGI